MLELLLIPFRKVVALIGLLLMGIIIDLGAPQCTGLGKDEHSAAFKM
jgi:hypothetical protein